MHWDRYRDIIFYRAYAELKAEAQLSYMGYVWWLLEPLLNTVLFYVILVAVLEQSTKDSVSFLLVGAITWQWTSASISNSAGSIFDAGGMLVHVYLPKVILPLIVLLTTTWKFLFLFAFLLLWVWVAARPPSAAYLALPLLMILQMLLIAALSLPVAAIMPYFPDAKITVEAGLRTLLLISGVFFPIDKVSLAYRPYFYINPMAVLIQAYRSVLLDGKLPNWFLLAYVAGFSIVLLFFTFFFYRRIDLSVVKAINR